MANESLAACLAEIKANSGKFYVYVLSRPCGTPFYVGVGLARGNRHERIQDHEKYARGVDRSRKSVVIRFIWKSGESPRYRIESWHSTRECVFAREVELIACIGRRSEGAGPLVNGNGGGTGQFSPNAEIRAKMSASRRAAAARPEVRERASAAARRSMENPETREKVRVAAERQWADPDQRAQRSKISRRVWADDGYRAAMKEKHRLRTQDEAEKLAFIKRVAPTREAALRKSAEVRRADPTYRQRMSDIKKAQFAAPGAREARQLLSKALGEERARLRQECLRIVAEHGYGGAIPDGRSSAKVWQEFRAMLSMRAAVQ